MSHREIVDAITKATENNDIDTYMSLFAEDALLVIPIGEFRGSAAIRLQTADLMNSFATSTYETTTFVESGDTYAAEWKARLTNTGELHMPDGTTIPATGKTIQVAAAEVGHIENGRVQEMHVYFDMLSWIIQLGLMPS